MHSKWVLNSELVFRVAILVYIALLIFTISFGYYVLPYILFLVAFLIIYFNLSRIKLLMKIESFPLSYQISILFLLTVLLRFLLLAQDQVITRDIEMYVLRSEWFLSGKIPYAEFHVNKPPLYAYLLYLVGKSLGTTMYAFRAFFSIMDGLVTVFIFYLARYKNNHTFSLQASFAYAICPLPIVAIGLSGHYEPVVMIFVLLSIILFYRKRYYLSSIFLGVGFAFKFFPIVLLPFFAWKLESWKKRILYVILFTIPILISIIPILFMSPDAFWDYLYEQGYTWTAKKSFTFVFETITGFDNILGVSSSFLFTFLFLLLILIMFITWVLKKFDPSFWFKVVVVIFALYYGLFIIASMIFFQSDLGIDDPLPYMVAFAIIYFTMVLFLANQFWHRLDLNLAPSDEILVLSAFALIFLLFGSSQNNPWYLLWILPFVLIIKNNKIRLILLWLMFWNFEGLGISLLPGIGIG
jgi:hypothetical protein